MKLIVGLGNPDTEFAKTRHNIGFRVVDELGKKIEDGRWKMGAENGGWKLEKKFKSEVLKAKNVLLVKPQTYMNNSGLAVSAVAEYFKIQAEDIIIIHDDLDLPLGKIQLRKGGESAGHHGVESVIKSLGSDQFIRVRIGIGPAGGDPEEFVLEKFTKEEDSKLKTVIENLLLAIKTLLEKGLQVAQNQFN